MKTMKTLTINGIKYEIVDEVARANNALPEITEADNGSILMIVDGAPTWTSIVDGNEVAY